MTFSFADHVELLGHFIDRHHEIVEKIEGRLLNVQGKGVSRANDRAYFEQALNSCFFDQAVVPRDLLPLKGQLASMHLADGFEPVRLDRHAHALDPLELTIRAYRFWESYRWPGKNGRLAYARTIYGVFILRTLEDLSLRIWDDGDDRAGDRLREIQTLLDRLNETTHPNSFVRDARWLIQTAQGPLTRRLAPYFRIANHICASLADRERLELQKAGVKLAGGHLRSQLLYRARETGRPIDDPDVLAVTRNSNSMDAALLVRDLVPVLEAYDAARRAGDGGQREELADVILQGVSADPELFLARLDLLGPCTWIEDLFIDKGEDGRARHTLLGEGHLAMVERYGRTIRDVIEPLKEDAHRLDPAGKPYSPLGIAYGFCADILSNMAVDTLLSQPSHGLSLEDLFTSRERLEDKRSRANGWEKLPAAEGDQDCFVHSAEWAAQIFERTMNAVHARAMRRADANASDRRSARLFVVEESRPVESLPEDPGPGAVSAQEHCVTSDLKRALSSGATAFPRSQILSDRNEARFLASAESAGKWFGISKVVLTACTSQGKDGLITDVPPAVLDVLRLACPGLLVVA